MVAHQRANLRAVRIALLGGEGDGDLIVERRSGFAPLGLEKGDEIGIGARKDGNVDLEIAGYVVDDARRCRLERIGIGFVGRRSDGTLGKMVEQ